MSTFYATKCLHNRNNSMAIYRPSLEEFKL